MGKWTTNFNVEEFADKYGENKTNPIVCKRMQKVYDYLSQTERGVSKVVITSGYRGEKETHDVHGAFIGDGHNCGIACDFVAYDKDGKQYSSDILAAVAEYVYFGGIAIIDDTAVHVDVRDEIPYFDKYGNQLFYWRGDERTGNNSAGEFKNLPKIVSRETFSSEIEIEGKKYVINLIEKSGY